MFKLFLVVLACVVVSVLSLPTIVDPLLGLQNIGNRVIQTDTLLKKQALQGGIGGYPTGYLSGYPSGYPLIPGYRYPYQSRIYREAIFEHDSTSEEHDGYILLEEFLDADISAEPSDDQAPSDNNEADKPENEEKLLL